jgi:hypothetical protein
VEYYYQTAKPLTYASQAKYVYNAELSTNQVNADLITTTFMPGVQVVLAGTATAGTSQAAQSSGTSTAGMTWRSHDTASATSGTSTIDSVSTTLSKLAAGGDFNLRAQYPLISKETASGNFTGMVTFLPNFGFMLNGTSGQETISQVTNYSFNFPVEGYFAWSSLPGTSQAVLFGDFKYGGQWVSGQLAQSAHLGSIFGIGYAAFGIELMNNVRIGGQYFLGPNAAYCASDTAACTTPTSVKGFRFVVSFSPPTSK